MDPISTVQRQIELSRKVAARSQDADDYLELAGLLFEARRFEEAVNTLKEGLNTRLPELGRAALLTALGWYVDTTTGGVDESRMLGEQAVALTEGMETNEALLTRAKAKSLMASCTSRDNDNQARELAASALSLFELVLEREAPHEAMNVFEILWEVARLNCLLGRFDEAATRCKQALRSASNPNQEIESLIELGTIYREGGRLTEARETFRRLIMHSNVAPLGLVRSYHEMGLAEEGLGKLAEARAKAQKALGILSDPTLPRVYLPELLQMVGRISFSMEDLEEAVVAFRSAVDCYPATDPLHWNCLLWLARCQYDIGQFEPAKRNAELISQSSTAFQADRAGAKDLLQEVQLSISEPH